MAKGGPYEECSESQTNASHSLRGLALMIQQQFLPVVVGHVLDDLKLVDGIRDTLGLLRRFFYPSGTAFNIIASWHNHFLTCKKKI
jgi:hypothetical protein